MGGPARLPEMPEQIIATECSNCHRPLKIKAPACRIINDIAVSVLIASHPEPTTCECGVSFMPLFGGIGKISWMFAPVETPRKIEKPPVGLVIPRA